MRVQIVHIEIPADDTAAARFDVEDIKAAPLAPWHGDAKASGRRANQSRAASVVRACEDG